MLDRFLSVGAANRPMKRSAIKKSDVSILLFLTLRWERTSGARLDSWPVAGGHRTTEQVPDSIITYSSVVSRDSVRIALTIAALNGLQIAACDIQNVYLTADCREKIWTVGGLEFGSEAGIIFFTLQ